MTNTDDNTKNDLSEPTLRRTTWSVVALTSGALALIAVIVSLTIHKMAESEPFGEKMQWYIISLIAIAGTVTIGSVFIKMRRGIRQQNLRALGVVLIAILVSLLAVASNRYESAFGILGAIAGYLFGKDQAAQGEAEG